MGPAGGLDQEGEGEAEGAADGEGTADGDADGAVDADADADGALDADADGAADPDPDGAADADGVTDPDADGAALGEAVGMAVGGGVGVPVRMPPLPRKIPYSRIDAKTTTVATTKIFEAGSLTWTATSETVGARVAPGGGAARRQVGRAATRPGPPGVSTTAVSSSANDASSASWSA